jgi:hypothetical protein
MPTKLDQFGRRPSFLVVGRQSNELVEPPQTERRLRRIQTTTRRGVQRQANVAPKAGRTSAKRTSKAVEYD